MKAHQQTMGEILFDCTRDIILFVHPDGRILDANKAAVRAYGYSYDEIRELTIFHLRYHPTHTLVTEEMERAASEGILFESLHRRRDGSVFPVEVSSQGGQLGEEKVLISVIRDISERKRIEQEREALLAEVQHQNETQAELNADLEITLEELRQAEEELIAHRNHLEEVVMERTKELANFAAIVGYSNDAIIGKDLAGHITNWNKEAERIYGYAANEVIGESLEMMMPPIIQESFPEILARLQRGEGFRDMESQCFRKDGSLVYTSINESPIRNERGEVVGSVTIARDISQRKKLELELARYRDHLEALVQERTKNLEIANARLQQEIEERKRAEQRILELNGHLERRAADLDAANKELESFSYSVSHDLRTPLRSIDGFSRLLQEDYAPALDDMGQNYLKRVRRASQRMGQIIDDLLNLSRVSRSQLNQIEVDLSKLAQQICTDLQQQEATRTCRFTIAQNVTAYGDLRLLRIALENLLSNAWKFTSKQPESEIQFGTTKLEGELVFFIRDNGAGFAMEYANKLFGAFQRLHHQEEFPGTGIGLATVQRIIRRHSGRIWAESAVGEGATFYFTLGKIG